MTEPHVLTPKEIKAYFPWASEDFIAKNTGQGPVAGKGKPRTAKAGKGTETPLQDTVIALLRTLGYQFVYHTHSSRYSEGGFPDVLAIRTPSLGGHSARFVLIEFKRRNGKLRPAKMTKKGRWIPGQADWLQAFSGVGAESYVCRVGDDLQELTEVLR